MKRTEDFQKESPEEEQVPSLTNLLRSKIRDEDGLCRVMYLLCEAQEAIRESGLNQDVVIIGSSIVGAQKLDVDVYLDVYNVHERDRKTHDYLYLNQYQIFLEAFERRLQGLRVPKSHLPSIQVHNLFDRSNQSLGFMYDYRFRVSEERVAVETRDYSHDLDVRALPPESVNWQNLNQLVRS